MSGLGAKLRYQVFPNSYVALELEMALWNDMRQETSVCRILDHPASGAGPLKFHFLRHFGALDSSSWLCYRQLLLMLTWSAQG